MFKSIVSFVVSFGVLALANMPVLAQGYYPDADSQRAYDTGYRIGQALGPLCWIVCCLVVVGVFVAVILFATRKKKQAPAAAPTAPVETVKPKKAAKKK